MAGRIKRPCKTPGCTALVVNGYCDVCSKRMPEKKVFVPRFRDRKTAHERGYGHRWQLTSKGFLKKHPLCTDPFKRHGERLEAAVLTDHIIAHKGNMVLFWDRKNWQPLCKVCHDRKTALEDGGFGRVMMRPEVIVVCGPPAAGKSTYVNARKAVGDMVWDHDAMMMTLTGLDSHERSERSSRLLRYVMVMRDAFFEEVRNSKRAARVWIIQSCPTEEERQTWRDKFDAKVILLDTEEDVCAERIIERGPGWDEPLRAWFRRFRGDQARGGVKSSLLGQRTPPIYRDI